MFRQLISSSTFRVARHQPQRCFSSFLNARNTDTSLSAKKSFSTEEPPKGVFNKVACIGTGKMAQALIEPMVKTGLVPKENFFIYDVYQDTMDSVVERFGVQPTESISEVVQDADLIMCAVKPQNLTDRFFEEVKKGNNPDAIFLSVIAGKPINAFEQGGMNKVVRSMPNTPAQVGEGMTVWSCTDNVTAAERKKIIQILQSCGESMYVDSEDFIDMATSISGSGPAYIFLLMESLIDGGKCCDFDATLTNV